MDYCWEICGDGYDYRYYDCDDGNLIAGDGCDASCKIELGMACDFGTYDGNWGGLKGTAGNQPWYNATTPYYSDICWEICGDGLDLHWYECDDSNNTPGDGCDANCEIEPGWACEYGTRDWHDWCWHWHNNPAIVDSYIVNDNEMHIFFNTSV